MKFVAAVSQYLWFVVAGVGTLTGVLMILIDIRDDDVDMLPTEVYLVLAMVVVIAGFIAVYRRGGESRLPSPDPNRASAKSRPSGSAVTGHGKRVAMELVNSEFTGRGQTRIRDHDRGIVARDSTITTDELDVE